MIRRYSGVWRAWLVRLAVVLVAASCGSGGGDGDSGTAIPGPGDPEFGRQGNLLAADRSIDSDPPVEMWIGFDSADEWQHFLALQSSTDGRVPYVGGRIVVDPSRELGFYFDPTTTFAAEVVAGGLVTTLRALSLDPDRAAAAAHPWAVGIEAKRIVSADAD